MYYHYKKCTEKKKKKEEFDANTVSTEILWNNTVTITFITYNYERITYNSLIY